MSSKFASLLRTFVMFCVFTGGHGASWILKYKFLRKADLKNQHMSPVIQAAAKVKIVMGHQWKESCTQTKGQNN